MFSISITIKHLGHLGETRFWKPLLRSEYSFTDCICLHYKTYTKGSYFFYSQHVGNKGNPLSPCEFMTFAPQILNLIYHWQKTHPCPALKQSCSEWKKWWDLVAELLDLAFNIILPLGLSVSCESFAIVPLNLLTYRKWVTALKYPVYSQILHCGWHGNHTGWLNMRRGDGGVRKLKKNLLASGKGCFFLGGRRRWTINIGKK